MCLLAWELYTTRILYVLLSGFCRGSTRLAKFVGFGLQVRLGDRALVLGVLRGPKPQPVRALEQATNLILGFEATNEKKV